MEIPRTYLQIASLIGDPALLREMIRVGAMIDIRDSKGRTALYIVLESLRLFQVAQPIAQMMPLIAEMWTRNAAPVERW